MKQLIISTGNADKFLTARHVAEKLGIEVIQNNLDIIEIQHEDPEVIALDKAQKAYDIVKAPVVISDDSWSFEGLNGFPGGYMHSMNEWFTSQDFLNLTFPLKNRKVIFTQYIVYQDAHLQKVFTRTSTGTLLKEIRGTSSNPSLNITAMDSDGGLSIAEAVEKRINHDSHESAIVWSECMTWFLQNE